MVAIDYLESARPKNRCSVVLTLMLSPVEICSGTCTTSPVDKVAVHQEDMPRLNIILDVQ